MIRVRLINEGKVVKQITSRLHEGVVLAQIEKYQDPFDTVQIIEGDLSEGAKDMLHHVAKKIIPAAMAAGVALGGASGAQAQGGANPNYLGLNYSVGDHIRDIVSPNYRERVRQREHQRSTERQVWDAEQNELRRQRIEAARAKARTHAEQNKVYDQARNSGDGKFIIIYGMDDRVTRIPAKGTEFMPADSQRLAHYITPNGQVYYVRHPHTAGIASSIPRESVTEAGTVGTVGTIPASGTSSAPSSNMQKKTQFAPAGQTTDVQVNDKGELELADPNALDPMTKQKMAKAGLKIAEAAQDNDSPVVRAVTARILHSRLDLLQKYGPEKIMAAIDDVAEWVGDVDEIGTSDVSAWVKDVERSLGEMNESIVEGANELDAILDQYSADWEKFKAGGDIDENVDFYYALYDYWSGTGEMPYGTMKGRTGDPVEWITQRMDQEAGNHEVAEAEYDDEASPADQAAADKNIIMQIRRAADYEKSTEIQLGDGEVGKINSRIAQELLSHFDRMKPESKALLQQTLNTKTGFDEIVKHFGGIQDEAVTRVGKIFAQAMQESGWKL